jgi:hypothetical protein
MNNSETMTNGAGCTAPNLLESLTEKLTIKLEEVNIGAGKTAQALSAVGEKIAELASDVRDSLPSRKNIDAALGSAAGSVDSAGHYLSHKSTTEMLQDISTIIRKYPVRSLCLGLGAGLLLMKHINSK